MEQGGDRGKAPNKTGTQPKGRTRKSPDKPGSKEVKSGVGKGAQDSTHTAQKAMGLKTSETRNTQ